MRATKYLFFLFGLLVLYAISVPFAPIETGLAERIDGDIAFRDLGLGIESEHELEKRRGRGGGGRIRPSRPRPSRKTRPKKTKAKKTKPKAKKTKPKAKKPATKPKTKQPATKPKTKQPATKPKTKQPATKPKTKQPATKPKTKHPQKCKRNGAKGSQSCPLPKKKNNCKRTGAGGSQDCGKTENYKVAEAAARKKGKTLKLNQAYMLKFQTKPGQNHHAKLIVGTVRKNKQGQLDFEASASELVFHDRDLQGCDVYFGAECAHKPTVQYDCTNDQARFQLGKYTFKGAASPEFADPQHFLDNGEMILNKHPKYNILFNNCRWHARRVANVAKLKKGEDPTVPERPATPEPSSPTWSEPESPGRRPLQVMNPDADSDSE